MPDEGKNIQAKGGKARAESLSAEEREDIARAAADARWSKVPDRHHTPRAEYGSPDRPLRIGDLEIPCYVLDDGRRVVTQGGMLTALDMSPGTATKGGGDRLANFANTKSIKPSVSAKLEEMIRNPIRFKAHGSMAYGYEAIILPEICDAVLSARQRGDLNRQQEHIAKQCEILVRAFARVGIIALVDEATGYQEIRDREALQEILKKYISEQLLEWVKTFPLDFYKEIFRLKGWGWNSGKMPGIVGKYTNDLVYARLAPGVLAELRRLNPPTEKGYRRYRHHQYLTRDIGHPALGRHLYELLGMMRASDSWEKFYRLVERVYPKVNTNLLLPFEGEDEAA
jgi:P63C domain